MPPVTQSDIRTRRVVAYGSIIATILSLILLLLVVADVVSLSVP